MTITRISCGYLSCRVSIFFRFIYEPYPHGSHRTHFLVPRWLRRALVIIFVVAPFEHNDFNTRLQLLILWVPCSLLFFSVCKPNPQSRKLLLSIDIRLLLLNISIMYAQLPIWMHIKRDVTYVKVAVDIQIRLQRRPVDGCLTATH